MEMEMLELMRSRHSDFESLSSTPKIRYAYLFSF
jgi:hypothetical protein